MNATDSRRLARRCGIVAPLLALGAVFLATLLAAPETFTWRERALSDMGRYGTRTFWLFNGGLVVAGLVGVPFWVHLLAAGRNRLERLGAVLLAVAVFGMVGVGVFFLGHTAFYLERELHFPAALTLFVVAPIAQWTYGTGAILEGDAGLGLVSLWTGNAHLLGWAGWLLSRRAGGDPWAWFAVSEAVAAIAFGSWILVLAGPTQFDDGRAGNRERDAAGRSEAATDAKPVDRTETR
ncbi:DUF998 domain-containing protein [Natrialbaceae archaeon GCM10025810]|uniref:DUF998 domain-containing protein n=1 Tax=Halovalidus salilacus TaxID=3075124 RepID=UPI00360D211E